VVEQWLLQAKASIWQIGCFFGQLAVLFHPGLSTVKIGLSLRSWSMAQVISPSG
jgi:hypothetical protein